MSVSPDCSGFSRIMARRTSRIVQDFSQDYFTRLFHLRGGLTSTAVQAENRPFPAVFGVLTEAPASGA
jgi:hypothetical protein